MENEPQGDASSEKKGLSPLAWVGIGCGVLALLSIIVIVVVFGFVATKVSEVASDFNDNPAQAAAELAVRLNPELELIESDEEAGTITFENTKTGEEFTLNFEDIAEGRFTATTEEGNVVVDVTGDEEEGTVTVRTNEGVARFGAGTSLEDVPEWVPLYPDGEEAQGAYTTVTAEGVSGTVTVKTKEETQKVLDYYKALLEEEGYNVTLQTMNFGDEETQGMVIGQHEDGRTVNVVVARAEESTQVAIQYTGKKE